MHFSVLIKNTSHVMIAKFLSVTVLHWSKSREAASYFLNPLCLYLTNDMLPFFAFPSFEICIICIFHSSFFIFVSWLQPLPQSLILRLSTMIFPFSAKNFIFYYLLLCSLITVCVAGVSLPELSSFPTSPHSHSSFNNKKFLLCLPRATHSGHLEQQVKWYLGRTSSYSVETSKRCK